MCGEDIPINTTRYNEIVFTIFEQALTQHQAEEKCRCLSDPESDLAIIKTDDAFKHLEKVLKTLNSNVKYWRIGLKREKDEEAFGWNDGDVLTNPPNNFVNYNEVGCASIYVSKDSGFYMSLNCEQEYTEISGYICSTINYTSPQESQDIATTTSIPQNVMTKFTFGNTVQDNLTKTTSDIVDQSTKLSGPNTWTIVLIILGCIILIGIAVLIFKRRKRPNESEQIMLDHVESNRNRNTTQQSIQPIGQVPDGSGIAGYATIGEFQRTQHAAISNTGYEQSQDSIQSQNDRVTPEIETTYAVVNKKKSIEQKASSSHQEVDVTYAVVQKKKA
uniref:uncharacterized protein LOC120331337 n=1 Tax=Styela clava TaxID=7725 RepID=UPI00193AACB6|nr:uncharacterized protein LOC120331337 [Styela clava]